MRLRKQWLVEGNLQWDIVKFVVALGVVLNLLFFTAIYIYFSELNSQAIDLGVSSGNSFFNFIYEEQFHLISMVAVTSLISMVIACVLAIYLSNRIAGPVYRIKKELSRISNSTSGELKISIREDDYFQDLVKDLNQVLQQKK